MTSNDKQTSVDYLDLISHPIFLINNDGSIRFTNKAAIQLANEQQCDLPIGKLYVEFCPSLQNLNDEEVKHCHEGISAVLKKQRTQFQADYQLNENNWYRMDVKSVSDNTGAMIVHYNISDLKQAERQAELLLESPLDAMLLINTEGHIQLINSKLEELFGYSQDELFGQGLELLIPHRFRRQHKGHLQRYFAQPEMRPMGINLELSALAKDGREFPVEISLNPIKVTTSFLVSAAIRDISAQKEKEAEVSRLGRILEGSVNEIYLFNAQDFRFIYANEAALKNLAYSSDVFMQLTPLDILHDYNLSEFEQLLSPLRLGAKDRLSFSSNLYRQDGSSYPALVQVQYFTQESPPIFLASVTDISEQERVSRALQESQERMQKHLQHTPLAVIEWRTEDRIITGWNPASEALFGYSQDEVLEQATADIIVAEEDKSQLEAVWRGDLPDRAKRNTNRNFTKDGQTLIFEWYNTAIKNQDGEITRVAALGLDVTARQQALEALLSAQEEERARISRDLHDQVGQSLTGLILSLGSKSKDDQFDRSVIKHQAETILSDVRRISRDLRPPLLDELGLVAALKRFCRDISEQAQLEVDSYLQAVESLTKEQESVIYRVVQEALTNVVRHANASHASVTLTTQNDRVLVVIEDDGQGFNLSAVSAARHIGLVGMRERVELVGGQLNVESKEDHGTTITARFKA